MINMKVKALGEKFGSQRGRHVLDVKDEEPRWEEERKTAEHEEKKKNPRKGVKFRRDGF